MKAEIIVIGDEILIGQVQDTNSGWLCNELNTLGFDVSRITVVQDRSEALLAALQEAKDRSPLVILTGGLGPTRDDLTKETFCSFFNIDLHFDQKVYDHLSELLRSYGRDVNLFNRQQAEVPRSAEILLNFCGTAPGFWIQSGSTIFVALPGVPFEMKEMFQKQLQPRLIERFNTPFNIHRTLLTEGIAESDLAELIEHWELALPGNIRLAYLPKPGTVRLRLSGSGPDRDKLGLAIDREIERILPLLKHYFKGFETIPAEEVLGKLLRDKKLTLGIAESCTGGYLSQLITRIPGSSDYFLGALISYSNQIKTSKLGVSELALNKFGSVSEEVAIEMAEHARDFFTSDLGIGITGIAGPGGATATKPIGLVFIAVSTSAGTTVNKFNFRNDRSGNIKRSANAGLALLIQAALKS